MKLRCSLLALVVTLCGCIQTVRFGDDPLAGITSLVVTPAETTLTLNDLAAAPTRIEYTATGTFDDGTTRDVNAYVGWGVDNPGPGAFIGDGRYETSQAAAGHVTVRATAGQVEGTAKLDVIATITIVDDVFPPPVGAETLFAGGAPVVAADPTRSPSLLYPAPETRFPQGLARILFQYTQGRMNHDAFRLRFESDVLHLTVLTGTNRWQPDSSVWTLISRSHWGATTQLDIEAAASVDPGTIYASGNVPLSFSRGEPGGAVYYWSASSSAVMRTTPAATSATKLFPAEGDATCAGCHAVSRDGSKMVVGYDGEKQQTVTLGDGAIVPNAAAGRPMGWATFSPNGDMVLVAEKGTLTLLDANTGEPIGPDNGRVPLATKATHPDWSPDGGYVAVALSGDVANQEVKIASIARIPFSEGTWGEPEILVASTGDNNYFPRWSPDGRFIAYVNAATSSKIAVSAELRMIRADGGVPIRLRLANSRIGSTDDVIDMANTMPAWSPANDDVAWLSFSSIRPYGEIRPIAGPSQVWISAIDLARAEQGLDPSSPAFWLPSQDIRVVNNNPVWAPVLLVTQ